MLPINLIRPIPASIVTILPDDSVVESIPGYVIHLQVIGVGGPNSTPTPTSAILVGSSGQGTFAATAGGMSAGIVSWAGVPAGVYTLTLNATGYSTSVSTITVYGDEDVLPSTILITGDSGE